METDNDKLETGKKERPLIVPLSTMKSGQEGIVKLVTSGMGFGGRGSGGMGFIKKLLNIGIRTGSKIKVINASGGPIIISSEGTKAAIGRGAASRILIEVNETKKDASNAG